MTKPEPLTDDQIARLRERWVPSSGHALTPAYALEDVHTLLDEIDRLREENEAGRKLNVYQAQRLADLHLDAMERGEGGERG